MNYIKVKRKDEERFTIVPAVNKAFYESQGYKVSTPTKEEIAKFFPDTQKKLKVKS